MTMVMKKKILKCSLLMSKAIYTKTYSTLACLPNKKHGQ